MRTSLPTASLVLLVLALVAVPALAAQPDQPLRAALLGSPTASTADAADVDAAFAANGCYTDATGDVHRGPDGPIEAAPQADTTGFCLDHNAASLGVSMTVPQGTDPATDPVWDDLGAAAVFLYESADGQPREIQLSTQRGDGAFEYLVLEGQFAPTLVCSGGAVFDAGTYRASVPADCLDAPADLHVLAGFLYDRSSGASNALTDLAPADGEFVTIPLNAPAGAERITRLEGPNRIETAIAVSQEGFADGEASAVIVASADNYPDALVAAPLAVSRQAPVLLSWASGATADVLAEARRVLGGTGAVLLMGGVAALPEPVADAFRAEGHTVTRVAGSNRFATSVAVAEAIESVPAEIVLAFGGDYPEALLAGAVAPPLGGVALLVDRTGVPAEVQAFLDAHPDTPVFTVGAVATDVVEGEARFATAPTPSLLSAALLQMYPEGGEVGVASVEAFPDGLTGGAYAASRAIPLLLSPRDSLTQGLIDGMTSYGPYERITFFGGDAALSTTTAGQAATHLQ